MIDDSTAHGSGADPRRNWAHMRDRMREVIHAELDRIHPTNDARRALELIIESSVRPSEVDGALKLTIIDHEGKPRVIEKNGTQAEFTLHDLLDELRVKYPVLFRPAKPDAAMTAEEDRPRKTEKPKRDWMNLAPEGAGTNAEAEAAPIQAEPILPRQPQGEGLRLPEWSRNTVETLKASIAPIHENAQAEDHSVPVAAEHERNVFGDMRTHSWLRPGLAVAAIAVLGLLGVGAFLFQGDHAPASRASAVASGSAASGPIRDPEPSATGSTTSSSGALRGVPDVIDTATLSLNGEVVRLYGVEWAPGAGKPEDLTQYLQGREVSCDPVGGNDTYRCRVGEQDLSRVVLFNGGGRPTDDATPELKAAADKAREAKIGVWAKQQP